MNLDFDASDTANQDVQDDAPAGSADQINAADIQIADTVDVNLNTFGGFQNTGLPTSLSGSVALVNDTDSSSLSKPGINANLNSSEIYLTNDLPSDPGRTLALVDQGEGGVYLQWTTPINGQTMGANANADLAAVLGGNTVLLGVSDGLTNGGLGWQNLCYEAAPAGGITPTADVPCDPTAFSLWIQGGGGHSNFGSIGSGVDEVEGFDQTTWYLSAGLDYAFTENWSFGAFGAYSTTDADLGSVDGYNGSRSSDANIDSWWGGGYVKASYDAFYLTGVGIFGKGSTDLTNGVLFDAESDYDSFIWGLSGTTGYKIAMGSGGFFLDPRLQLKYMLSDTDDYEDSYGLGLNSSTEEFRAAMTLGMVFEDPGSAWHLGLRAGVVYYDFHTDVDAEDSISGTSASFTREQNEWGGTAAADMVWDASDWMSVNANVSGDFAEDIESLSGNLGVTFRLN